MDNLVGWTGSTLLAFCGLPQAISTIRSGNADGISISFLISWLAGEVLTLIYVIPSLNLPLLFNYVANIVFINIICYFKFFPRMQNDG